MDSGTWWCSIPGGGYMAKRKAVPVPKVPVELQNKREREGYEPTGPRKLRAGRPLVDAPEKRDRSQVAPPTIVHRPEPTEDTVLTYSVARTRQGWVIAEARLPSHVVDSYEYKVVAGPDDIGMVLAKLCERVEHRGWWEGK